MKKISIELDILEANMLMEALYSYYCDVDFKKYSDEHSQMCIKTEQAKKKLFRKIKRKFQL